MSLLLFAHDAESVIIVTDTLATAPDGEAFMFQSKCWALPHMNLVIAITGIANLGAAWNDRLRTAAVARDIEDVNGFAQQELTLLWRELLAQHEVNEDVTATIYHFGYPAGSDAPVRYTYRSQTGFQPERSEGPGFGAKPAPESFELESPDSFDGFVELALAIRQEQDAKKHPERIVIGGELFLTFLRNWSTQTARIHRFDDYEEDWIEMVNRMRRENR